MKKILLLLSASLLLSCGNDQGPFRIKGKVSNYSKDYALLVKDTPGIGISTAIDTIPIDDNGHFEIEGEVLKADSFLIFDEEGSIDLTIPKAVSSAIHLDINLSAPDSVKIKGEQAGFIQYHLDQQKYWTALYDNLSRKHQVLASGNNQTSDYHKIQDTITDLRIDFLENYFRGTEIQNQEEFITAERNSLMYSNLYYRMSGQKSDIVELLEFYKNPDEHSEELLTYSEEVDFSDASLFQLHFYRQFINNALMNIVSFENPEGNLKSYEFYLDKGLKLIDRWFKAPEVNNLQKIIYIHHLVKNALLFKNPVNIYEFQKALEGLKGSQFSDENLRLVEKELQQLDALITKISAQTNAPDFELEDPEGNLHTSSNFTGKIILMDVWASWCGPCIASFPEWNKLVVEYSDNSDFEFLSVSLDKDRNKWLESVEKYGLEGLKLHAGSKEFESAFAKDFEINFLPRYIAIDSSGNFIAVSTSVSGLEDIIKNNR